MVTHKRSARATLLGIAFHAKVWAIFSIHVTGEIRQKTGNSTASVIKTVGRNPSMQVKRIKASPTLVLLGKEGAGFLSTQSHCMKSSGANGESALPHPYFITDCASIIL